MDDIILYYDSVYDRWTVQSILIGVGGFWGGVFCMGLLYLLAVLTKRVFKPEEAEKIAEWRDAEIFYTLYMQEVAEPEKIKTEPVNNLLEIHRSKVCTALSCCCFSSLLCILHRRLILTVGRFLDWGQTIESNRASELSEGQHFISWPRYVARCTRTTTYPDNWLLQYQDFVVGWAGNTLIDRHVCNDGKGFMDKCPNIRFS